MPAVELPLDELQARLAALRVAGIRRLAGGASSLTYAGTTAGGREVVVKVAPAGVPPVLNRDVLRQARVLRALGGTGVPVPEVLWEDGGNPPGVPPLFVMSFVAGTSLEPLFDLDVNLRGLLNLLEGARAGGVRRVVFASSGGVVYGDATAPPCREGATKLPISPYGVAKLASEHYLSAYSRLYGLEVASLRYSNVYGPRQNAQGEAGVVAIFARKILAGEPLTIFGDGEQTRDMVYVKDVAAANLAASDRPLPPLDGLDARAWNIGTGIETSVKRLAELLAAAAGRRPTIRYAPERPGELRRSALAVEKAAHELGWAPRTGLADGLALTLRSFGED